MFRPWMKKLAIVALGIVAGLAIGIVYGQVRLQGQEKVYAARIKEINQRLSQVQRRYAQGVSAQDDLEQQKQSIQEEVDKLTKEKGMLGAQQAELKTKADGLEAQVAYSRKKCIARGEGNVTQLKEQ